MPLHVLIAGASVAGPVAAYWFAKAGAQVTIIERFPSLRTNGQNVDIRTIGVTVMKKMQGMEEAVRAKTTAIEGFSFRHENDVEFAVMKATGDENQQSLVSEYEIFRGDLSEIVYDLTKNNPKIKYVFGEQVSAMNQKESGPITVTFSNGYPAADYDLVVACDGATSRTRALGLNCGVRDHIHSVNSWNAYYSLDEDLLEGGNLGKGFCATKGRLLVIGPDPAGGCRAVLMSMHPSSEHDATLPFREASELGTDALKEHTAQRFRGVGWKSDEMIQGMMDSKDFYASEVVQVKVPALYNGRFVLCGDAGYAPGPTGTGTSLAIGGAYVLAGEISRHKGDLAAGLKAYEDRMRPIIKDLQKVPAGFPGIMAPQTTFRIWLRNVLLRVVCWGMSASGYFGWITSFWSSAFGGDEFDVPEYVWEE